MKRNFLEEAMYDVIRDHFTDLGYEVHGEVKDCDVTATKDGELIILELKKSLSMTLLIQAVKRQKIGDFTYLCVPRPKRFVKNRAFGDLIHLLKRLSLGLIFCDPERATMEVILEPVAFDLAQSRRQNKAKRARLLDEINRRKSSLNRGGSKGKKLMTAYREDAIRLLYLADQLDIIAPKDGVAQGIKKAPAILQDNYYGWFLRIARGKYAVTEAGKLALAQYEAHLDLLTADLVLEKEKKTCEIEAE